MSYVFKRDYTCAPKGHTIVEYKEGDPVPDEALKFAKSDKAVVKKKKQSGKKEKDEGESK